MFKEVPSSPDFVAMEHGVLAKWETEKTFDKLRERNDTPGSPVYSFIDGPMTANNSMGVHHAWGRAYKDIFQRFKAMQGFAQRYQNGFDCQGLWVEVEVEKELGLTAKGGIMELGLEKFSEHCRARVNKYSGIQTEQSKRLGQWMDWENSYYTMDNGNILHIWHFLKVCHDKGWLNKGHRVMPWCCRCGTSLSQHELSDSYKDMTHTSAFVRFPLAVGEASLLVWTTTPWTLPANTGVAVHPDLVYALFDSGDGHGPMWVSVESPEGRRLTKAGVPVKAMVRGKELAGLRYAPPFGNMETPSKVCGPAGDGWRVVLWDEVTGEDGTGLVHIAPGCGAEDHGLGRAEGLPVLAPIDGSGRYLEGYGDLTGMELKQAGKAVLRYLALEGSGAGTPLLFRQEQYKHRYPVCWRCGDELAYRLEDEWFLVCDGLREPMRRAASEVEWLPESSGKRMDDWLVNMGDWCISRKRYWGMPLPFYPCSCGHLTVIGSLGELRDLALEPGMVGDELDLHRPYVDSVLIRCPACGAPVRRVTEVGDCWLDAGIVPFSTLGYLDGTQGRRNWERWFPAEFVCEMREQIRLWFYSQLFMSVAMTGKAPYRKVMTYEKVYDEKGRPMHKSSGNAIWFDDAVERMGADVMRWLYAARNPTINLNFGYAEGSKVRARLITLWNVYSFLATYARVDGWEPSAVHGDPDNPPSLDHSGAPDSSRLLDLWLVSRTKGMAEKVKEALEGYDCATAVREFDSYLEDLSNWYVRRNRRRFWKSEADTDKRTGYAALHWALLTFCRVAAPVIPFLAEAMWEGLSAGTDLPESVHLTMYPDMVMTDEDLVAIREMDLVRNLVNLGLSQRGAAGFRVRQPLSRMEVGLPAGVAGLPPGTLEILGEEVNVKEVLVAGTPVQGREPTVWLDVDPCLELLWEGASRDLVRQVQSMRKSQGFKVEDRISLVVACSRDAVTGLGPYLEYLKDETLCGQLDVRLDSDGSEGWQRVGTFAGDIWVMVSPA